MAVLHGTIVASKIVPTDSLDTFATHDEKYGQGGYRSVPSIADRDSIPAERRREGMLVNVVDTDTIYKLTGGTDNTCWVKLSIGGTPTAYKTYAAGSTVIAGRAVLISSTGLLEHAEPEYALSLIGIAINNASIGENVNVVTEGEVRDSGYSFTPGLPVFFVANGVLTQTPPGTISSYIIGTATSTDTFTFDKSIPIFLLG